MLSILKHPEWQQVEIFLKNELCEKPINLKNYTGMSSDAIAMDILSTKIANDKIIKALSKLKRLGTKSTNNNESWI